MFAPTQEEDLARMKAANLEKVSLSSKLQVLSKDPRSFSVRLPNQIGLLTERLNVITESALSPESVNEYLSLIKQEFRNIHWDVEDLLKSIKIQSQEEHSQGLELNLRAAIDLVESRTNRVKTGFREIFGKRF